MAKTVNIGEYSTDGWDVAFEFTINEPTILLNKWQRMHWAERSRYTIRWAWLVLNAIKHKPQTPLNQAWLHVERGSYGVLPDPDGLIGGLKPLIDILTCSSARKKHGLGLIEDDSPDHLQGLTAHSVKTLKGKGFTRVTIRTKQHA